MTDPPGEHGASAPHQNPWVVAAAVMLGTFMVILDSTVVNVSLPHIAGNLSSSVDETTWAITSYLAANAIILPMTGWLANYFGRKRLLILSLVGFTVSSFLCGLAPSLVVLILFRVLQGLSGGTLQPISQAVLLEAFPPADRGKAMGFWGLGIVVAPILGPVLGGWLTDNYSWRWVFYINVPIGIAAVVAARLYVFDPHYLRRAERVDVFGIVSLALGVGALQIALDKGNEDDWFASHLILSLSIVAVIGLVAFVIRELKAKHPIVDLSIVAERSYGVGLFLSTVIGFVLYGSMVLLPVLLQTLWGYPAMQAGMAMAPRGVGSFIAMPIIGILTSKLDPRKLVVAGLLSGAFTMFWLGELNLQAGYWDVFWPQFIQGISMALLFVPLTTIAMAPIPREGMGNAASLFNLMRNIGGSIGIAVTTTMLSNRMQFHRSSLSQYLTVYDPRVTSSVDRLAGQFVSRGIDLVTARARAVAMMIGNLQRQAAMMAFLDLFWVLGVVFLVVIPLLALMRRPHHTSSEVMAGE